MFGTRSSSEAVIRWTRFGLGAGRAAASVAVRWREAEYGDVTRPVPSLSTGAGRLGGRALAEPAAASTRKQDRRTDDGGGDRHGDEEDAAPRHAPPRRRLGLGGDPAHMLAKLGGRHRAGLSELGEKIRLRH